MRGRGIAKPRHDASCMTRVHLDAGDACALMDLPDPISFRT